MSSKLDCPLRQYKMNAVLQYLVGMRSRAERTFLKLGEDESTANSEGGCLELAPPPCELINKAMKCCYTHMCMCVYVTHQPPLHSGVGFKATSLGNTQIIGMFNNSVLQIFTKLTLPQGEGEIVCIYQHSFLPFSSHPTSLPPSLPHHACMHVYLYVTLTQ